MEFDQKNIDRESEVIDYIKGCINDDVEDILNNKPLNLGKETIPQFDEYRVYQNILDTIQESSDRLKQKRKINVISWWVAACVLVIALNVSYFVYHNHKVDSFALEEIDVPKGEKLLALLPDGSRVWLNADSKLTYPNQFGRSNREVTLEGEAYFEINEDKKNPFKVFVGNLAINVTGTSFNVKAYYTDKSITTTLDEGSINIENIHKKSIVYNMVPGQAAIYNKETDNLSISEREYHKEASSWKKNQLTFRDASLEDVLATLERRFDINFEIQDEHKYLFTYNFTCKSSDLSYILEVMESITPIKFKKADINTYTVF